MPSQIEVRLYEKEDKKGDKYLIGNLENSPSLIKVEDCTFIAFYPKEDDEGNIIAPGKLVIRARSEQSVT